MLIFGLPEFKKNENFDARAPAGTYKIIPELWLLEPMGGFDS